MGILRVVGEVIRPRIGSGFWVGFYLQRLKTFMGRGLKISYACMPKNF